MKTLKVWENKSKLRDQRTSKRLLHRIDLGELHVTMVITKELHITAKVKRRR